MQMQIQIQIQIQMWNTWSSSLLLSTSFHSLTVCAKSTIESGILIWIELESYSGAVAKINWMTVVYHGW